MSWVKSLITPHTITDLNRYVVNRYVINRTYNNRSVAKYHIRGGCPIEVNGLGWSIERTEKKINQLISQFTLIEEAKAIFPRWLDLVTRYQIKGKRTHDARLMAVAIANEISYILTFNPKDFTKIRELIIVHPNEIEPTTLE